VRIGIAIMAVPSRERAATALHEALPGSLVSYDCDQQGPWVGFKQAYAMLSEARPDTTHRLVIQDDVILCPNFVEVLERVVRVRPTSPLCLFTARQSDYDAADAKGVHLLASKHCDGQAVLFPVYLAQRAFDWIAHREGTAIAERQTWRNSSDQRLDTWSRMTYTPFLYTVPTLVDHDLTLKSTLRHPSRTRFGLRNSKRFAGEDALTIDWGRLPQK